MVVATETPVERYDRERGCVISEVLLMEGCQFRAGRDQLPIVDSHDDATVRNIIGSVQHLKTDFAAGELYGDPVFASDADAQVIASRFNEGHITDFSITAMPIEKMFIPRGQTFTTSRGAVIEGPAEIVTQWEPHNASICATGADVNSSVRRSYTDLDRKVLRMDEALLGQLKSMGLPDGLTDPNQVMAWVVGRMGSSAASVAEPIENAIDPPADVPAVEEEPKKEEETMTIENAADIATQVQRALDADKKRRKTIQDDCKLQKLERSYADELCDEGVTIEVARDRILRKIATQPSGTTVEGDHIRMTGSADDKFEAAARDGLVMRSLKFANTAAVERGRTQYDPFDGKKPAVGADDFARIPLVRIAEQFLQRSNVDTRYMTPRETALAAMGHGPTMQRFRIQRDSYHNTGSFSNILLDASNKSLQKGYEEAPFTWNMWARQGTSVPDFKTIYRTRFSESPNLEMVPENGDYAEGAMSDSKESYRVEKFGRIFSVTWETVVNDDLDALSRIPMMHGNAARRTVNKKVYQVLTDNAAMSDGVTLFHSTHANHSGAAAAVSAVTLNAMFVSMMKQTGLSGNIIGVMPKFVIGPPSCSAAIITLLTSMSDPAAGGSAVGNSGINNMYGPNGSRVLTPVIEPQLEAASTTTWYAAADPNQVDTVEVTFLQGEESPVIETEWDFEKDGWKHKIRQTFGTKAIDWRGLYTNQA